MLGWGSAPEREGRTGVLEEDDSGDLLHVFCVVCDPEGTISLCGTDLTGAEELEWGEEEPDDVICFVCDTFKRCPKCGAEFQ